MHVEFSMQRFDKFPQRQSGIAMTFMPATPTPYATSIYIRMNTLGVNVHCTAGRCVSCLYSLHSRHKAQGPDQIFPVHKIGLFRRASLSSCSRFTQSRPNTAPRDVITQITSNGLPPKVKLHCPVVVPRTKILSIQSHRNVAPA